MSFSEAMNLIPQRKDLIIEHFYVSKMLEEINASIPEDCWEKHVYFIDVFQDPALNIWTCYTLHIDKRALPMDEVMYYLARNLSGPWFDQERYSIFLHEKNQFVFSDFDIGRTKSVRTPKDPRSLSLGHTFQVGMSSNTILNTETNPCDEYNKQLLTPCVENFVMREIGCRMPWMRNGSYPICNSTNDIFRVAHLNKKIRIRIFDQIVNFTGCRPNCKYNSYSANFVTNFDDRQYAVALFIVQEDTPAIIEAYVYQYDDFLADFGGYLGLLVGVSALSLVEYVLYSVHFMGKKISRTGNNRREMKQ